MAMTLVVTRNVLDRVRGFLASCMCEIAPGVYAAPRMSPPVRERIWQVLCEWFEDAEGSGIVMTWPDSKQVGGQAFLVLGSPKNELCEHQGIFLVRNELTKESQRSLRSLKIQEMSMNEQPSTSQDGLEEVGLPTEGSKQE